MIATDKHSDPLDMASEMELASTERLLQEHRDRQRLKPLLSLDGTGKLCIDCGNEIPPARAAIAGVCRCLGCQEWEEKSRLLINPY